MASGWRIALWVAVVVLAIAFLYLVRGILLPFVVAFVVAALLEPLVHRLRLKGWSRRNAVLTVVVPVYLAGMVVMVLLASRVTTEVLSLSARVDTFTRSLSQDSELDNYFIHWNPEVQAEQARGLDGSIDRLLGQSQGWLSRLGLPGSRREIVEDYIAPQRPRIAEAVKQGFDSFFGLLAGFAKNLPGLLVIIVLPPALLMEMEEMKRRMPKFIPPSIRSSTMTLFSDIGQVFFKYLRGVATVMLLYAGCAAILLSLLGVPYAVMLAVLFAALYMVPMFGSIIVYITLFTTLGITGTQGGLFFHLGSPWAYAIVATAIYMAMGLTFDQFIYPVLVGNAVGLNTVTSIFVIFSGLALFGLIGMIIAFPLAGAVKIILDRVIRLTSVAQDHLALPSVPLRHRRSAVP